MNWIDRLQDELEVEKRRREADARRCEEDIEKGRADKGKVARSFLGIAERLIPKIRDTMDTIKNRLGVELRLNRGRGYIIIECGERKDFNYYSVRIEKRGVDSGLFIEATEDTSVPSGWQGTTAEWRGEVSPSRLRLLTSVEELEAKQLGALMEWITASALGKKPQLPFLEAVRSKQESAKRKKKDISLPFAIFLGLVALAAIFLLWYCLSVGG